MEFSPCNLHQTLAEHCTEVEKKKWSSMLVLIIKTIFNVAGLTVKLLDIPGLAKVLREKSVLSTLSFAAF